MLYIRPVHRANDGPLLSLALTIRDGALLQDSDVLEHFPADTPGCDIEQTAREFYGADAVKWGGIIEV